jgi:ribosomal protein S18 acetylase RimI-like enzyme
MMEKTVEIVRLAQYDIPLLQPSILKVYRKAFGPPPYNEGDADTQAFGENFGYHVHRTGFRCLLAREVPSGLVVGFVYGCTSRAGQWWYDVVAAGLGPEQSTRWLNSAFEMIELAVIPDMQGRGIGGRLHDRLLVGLPHTTALLSTMQVETSAQRLYYRRGWTPLLENFYFPGVGDPYLVMGLELKSIHSGSG